MPRLTRKTVRQLPHRRASGLFLTSSGDYVADIRPDDGRRVRRKLGIDRRVALSLFESLLADIADDQEYRDNPLLLDFLAERFLPSQSNLRSFAFSRERVSAVAGFLRAQFPHLRLRDVGLIHGEALKEFHACVSPRTVQANLQKLKQALNYAVDLGLIDANPLRRCKAPQFDNRRMRTCNMADVYTLLTACAEGTDMFHVVLLLALTGLRPSNVLALHSDEVVGNVVRVPPEKMKNLKWGIIPTSFLVQEVLADLHPDPYYFPSRLHQQRPRRSIFDAWRVAVGQVTR